jgi:hypothetical protein
MLSWAALDAEGDEVDAVAVEALANTAILFACASRVGAAVGKMFSRWVHPTAVVGGRVMDMAGSCLDRTSLGALKRAVSCTSDSAGEGVPSNEFMDGWATAAHAWVDKWGAAQQEGEASAGAPDSDSDVSDSDDDL